MKVCYLLGSLNRGGTETLLLDVCRNSVAAPFAMVLVHRRGGALESDFAATGVKMYHLEHSRRRLWAYIRRLRRVLLDEKVDIVHAQQAVDAVYARLACQGTKVRVVETFHGYDMESSRLSKWLNRLSIRLSDRVCFVSLTQRDYYVKAYGLQRCADKVCVVYNGIDMSKFSKQYEEPDFLRHIDSATAESKVSSSTSERRIRMAMVGNFVSGRSQSYPLMSIELLKEQGIDDFDFYFVGRRNDKEPWRYDDCVRYAEEHHLDNVHFVGGRSDVPAILQHIDAFVYSTDHDTFGIAVVEAMAAGVPVFVNDWSVMCEVVIRGGYSQSSLWQSRNYKDLAERLKSFVSAPEAYKEQADKLRQTVRDTYGIEAHLCRLNMIYKQIVS